MSSTAKPTPLPIRQRRLFLAQFEKDLDFFRLFFLLVNKSRIIRHVGVTWAQDGPAAEMGLQKLLDTEDATRSPCSRYVHIDPQLDPEFCQLVNDNGRHEAESCAISDRTAEKHCRETGVTQIYTCHAGLVDIAVPVISGGQYIGTLFCGQSLRESPSEAGFQKIRLDLSLLDVSGLSEAGVGLLESPGIFGRGHSKRGATTRGFCRLRGDLMGTPGRVGPGTAPDNARGASSAQGTGRTRFWRATGEIKSRCVSFCRSWTSLGRRTGCWWSRSNRKNSHYRLQTSSFDVAVESAVQAVEEVGDTLENVVVSRLRKQGICVFFHDSFPAYGLARRILDAVKAGCPVRARVGIGLARKEVYTLAGSHEEACMALAQFPDEIVLYRKPMGRFDDLSAAAEKVCACLTARKLTEARVAVHSLPVLAGRELGEGLGTSCQRSGTCSPPRFTRWRYVPGS